MPEGNGPPPLSADRTKSAEPRDENAFFWFDGILEGPIGDRDALRSAVIKLDAIGIVSVNLELDGGKYSVLLDDKSKLLEGVNDAQRLKLIQSIQDIVELSAAPNKVESTLRCTEVSSSSVHETLFALQNGKVEKISRRRSANSDDLLRRPRPISVLGETFVGGKSRRLMIGGLIVLFCLAIGIQFGIADRIFAPEPSEITIEHRQFGNYLTSSMDKKWGVYTLTITRGESFPSSMAEFDAIAKAAARLDESATLGVLARGETAYIQMLDDKDGVLYQKGVSLKPLLLADDASIQVLMPGFRKTSSIQLALAPRPVTN